MKMFLDMLRDFWFIILLPQFSICLTCSIYDDFMAHCFYFLLFIGGDIGGATPSQYIIPFNLHA